MLLSPEEDEMREAIDLIAHVPRRSDFGVLHHGNTIGQGTLRTLPHCARSERPSESAPFHAKRDYRFSSKAAVLSASRVEIRFRIRIRYCMQSVRGDREEHPRARRLVNGIGSLWGTAVAIAAAAGIPLAWIWLASQVAGTKRELTPSLAVFIATGIIVSYWLALLAGSWVRGRSMDRGEERARVRRRSWNRSFSDAPRPEDHRIDPIERLFIVVAVLAIIAFEIWFFIYAGDPLPSQPAF
jgi:hypothetical protein